MKPTKSPANPFVKNIEFGEYDLTVLVNALSKMQGDFEKEVCAYKSKNYDNLMNQKTNIREVLRSKECGDNESTQSQIHAIKKIIPKLIKARAEIYSDNQLNQ